MKHRIGIVFDIENDPPTLLGGYMPPHKDDENIVRYYDDENEKEHIVPADCVTVRWVEVEAWT
jgi:hypothetical protein